MKKKSFLNEYCAKTISRIITKFSHNVPLISEKILLSSRNAHATQRPLVAVFQKVSKNNMFSPRMNSWAAHNNLLEPCAVRPQCGRLRSPQLTVQCGQTCQDTTDSNTTDKKAEKFQQLRKFILVRWKGGFWCNYLHKKFLI